MGFLKVLQLHLIMLVGLALGIGATRTPLSARSAHCPLRSISLPRCSLPCDAPTVFSPSLPDGFKATRPRAARRQGVSMNLLGSGAAEAAGAGARGPKGALSAPLIAVAPSSAERGLFRRALSSLRATVENVDNLENNKGNKKKSKKERKAASTKPLEVHVIGLSHHNAKVEVREKLAVPQEEWNSVSADLCKYGTGSVAEAAVLSTCNRFEVFVSASDSRAAMLDATQFLSERSGVAPGELRGNLFMLSGEDAIWHLLRVAGGLDSLVVGEGQILSQTKACFEKATELPVEEAEGRPAVVGGSGGKVLSKLLNTAVAAGKRVRSETNISRGAVSISSAAAEFTAQRIPQDLGKDIQDARLLIIGAGTMSRLLLTHLSSQGIKKAVLMNRSSPRMEELAAEYPDMDIELHLTDTLWEEIAKADVVYTSTSATDPFVTKALLEEHGVSETMLVDISVPRNVDTDCNEVAGITAYNVDDLKAVVARNTALRQREVLEAEVLLAEEAEKFRGWQQSLGAIPAINALQQKAEAFRAAELKKVAGKLGELSNKERDAVERLSRGIVNKLLHGPMSTLRASDGTPEEQNRKLSTLNRMFGL